VISVLRHWQPSPAARAAVLAIAAAPLALLVVDAAFGGLGANPVEALLHRTGDWALRFLLLTLAVTPLRRLAGLPWLGSFRRPLGLIAFGYALLHGLAYAVLDRGLIFQEIAADVLERPYVTAGALALLLMVPLAVTSTRAMMRRLGGRRWQRLHRLVYAVGILAVLHFLWSSKLDRPEPVIYAAVLSVLLLARLPAALRGRRAGAGRPAGSVPSPRAP
jgi:sulfoxide reductase heme-binding subunit YedZ